MSECSRQSCIRALTNLKYDHFFLHTEWDGRNSCLQNFPYLLLCLTATPAAMPLGIFNFLRTRRCIVLSTQAPTGGVQKRPHSNETSSPYAFAEYPSRSLTLSAAAESTNRQIGPMALPAFLAQNNAYLHEGFAFCALTSTFHFNSLLKILRGVLLLSSRSKEIGRASRRCPGAARRVFPRAYPHSYLYV